MKKKVSDKLIEVFIPGSFEDLESGKAKWMTAKEIQKEIGITSKERTQLFIALAYKNYTGRLIKEESHYIVKRKC